jgi:hypothetical protein
MITINGFGEIVTQTAAETNVVKMLRKYTRTDLRALAKNWDIPRGQNKCDTIKNIAESSKFAVMFGMVV